MLTALLSYGSLDALKCMPPPANEESATLNCINNSHEFAAAVNHWEVQDQEMLALPGDALRHEYPVILFLSSS